VSFFACYIPFNGSKKENPLKNIALLTDFGYQDEYVGVMKGVILGISPDARIIDLCHSITPQSILQASLLLQRSYQFFPKETVFCCVVDPGVGTSRKPLAVRVGDWLFVGPDNGLFSPVIAVAKASGTLVDLIVLDQPKYWLEKIGRSFHGRDIFAPVSAHLANGVPLHLLGSSTKDFKELDLPTPQQVENGWEGTILHIDHFGNCSTNLSSEILKTVTNPRLIFNDHQIDRFTQTFGEANPGESIMMLDSSDHLSICVVNGNAQETFNLKLGDSVRLIEKI
jgi:S-adenosyl-L-methionine hydrolase (adenosine-forming)